MPGPRPLDTLAALDIGTNSFHLVVARVSGGGRFEVITREKDMVRLGHGDGDMKRLEPDAIDRGIAALDRCRRIAETWNAPLTAVATSAVREAENRDEFISRARVDAGVEVEVISGLEEARLIHLGVLQSVPVYDQRILMVDIGGGSTELLFGHGEDTMAARSLKLGAIRLTERFFRAGPIKASAVEACRRHVRDMLLPFVRETRNLSFDKLVASSGTSESLVAMGIARGGDDVPRALNAATLDRARLGEVIDDLVAAPSVEARAKLAGIDNTRADIIVGGAVILEQVMDLFAADALTYSDMALREGVLLDTLRRLGGTATHLSDLRRQSVLHLVELCDDDPEHSTLVSWLSSRLFDELGPLLGLDVEARDLLEAGALLANVGLFIAHSRHHQHSYYVIRNSEHLTGFTDREIEIVAQVARYHRKSAPSERHPQFASLRPQDREIVRGLAAILRVAIGLDRSHAGLVGRVEVDVDDDRIVIGVGGEPDDNLDLSLEIYSATARRTLLEEVSGRSVTIEALN